MQAMHSLIILRHIYSHTEVCLLAHDLFLLSDNINFIFVLSKNTTRFFGSMRWEILRS